MKKLLFLMTLFLSVNIYGKVTVQGTIKYQNTGKCYSVDINWYTGAELNEAVGSSFKYSSFSNYAVVFWGRNEATVMEVSGIICGGDTFTKNYLPISCSTGVDQGGKKWTIATGIFASC